MRGNFLKRSCPGVGRDCLNHGHRILEYTRQALIRIPSKSGPSSSLFAQYFQLSYWWYPSYYAVKDRWFFRPIPFPRGRDPFWSAQIQNEYIADAQNIGSGQKWQSSVLTKRIVGSWDENVVVFTIFRPLCRLWRRWALEPILNLCWEITV